MATIVDYGSQEQAMQAYFREGAARALALGNRGPIRLNAEGKLDPAILAAYSRCGFYVFEDVVGAEELAELHEAFHSLIDNAPTGPDSKLDAHGRPALGSDHGAPVIVWSKPLGDPYGGSEKGEGRHQIKMFEPTPAAGLPEQVPVSVLGSLQYGDAILRLYGHPGLLAVAAAVNGDDFVPFTEAIVVKKPGEGAIIAWHQDGMTHWDSPDWDEGSHGFNFMAQLYPSMPATGVWFVPGSHARGRADIKGMAAAAGSERLPQAVPLVCKPGDVAMSNRQIIHGSFANTSPDWRVTFNMGFNRRRSVLAAPGFNFDTGERVPIDPERIRKRAEMIGYGIDARRQRFPDETPFAYRPHVESGERYHWDDAARRAIRGYNALDIIV